MADADLRRLVAAELAEPVDPRVLEMAVAVAARHGAASRAVLFYGSCLRERQIEGLMLDFYLIVSDYRAAYGKRWLAAANRLIPPNVFPFAHEALSAKYAVLSEEDFERECSERSDTVSVWARFSQPSRLVWAADEAARERVVDAVALAAPTLLSETLPLHAEAAGEQDELGLWRFAYSLTYGAEIRAERRDRSASVVNADPERYRRFTGPALASLPGTLRTADTARRRWRRLRRNGKLLTVLRLAKASFTFAGGVDYLTWKINRHSGAGIVLRPWQRRWPLLAAITLLPRLLKRGAIR